MPTQAEIKLLRGLATRKGRRDQQRFLAEGVRLLEEAERHRFLPETVYFADSEINDRARELLSAFRLYKVACETVTARQMRQISDVKTTQGIAAVFPLPAGSQEIDTMPTELERRKYRKILLCDRISDPGNLGTLLRSALAFGFGVVALNDDCVDPYSPKVVRSSVGAIFGLRIFQSTTDQLLKLASDQGLTVIAADGSGADRIAEIDMRQRENNVLIAIGSEAEGISPEIIEAARWRIRIPHLPAVESLNAGVAGSILLSHFFEEKKL